MEERKIQLTCIFRGTQIFLVKLHFFISHFGVRRQTAEFSSPKKTSNESWIIQRPKGLVQVCSFNFEAPSSLSDLYVYEIGNTSSLPFWRTSTLRRLHRPPRPPIISCIPAPCPEPPVWSLEAITRHRPSEATHSTGYGLARRRRPYQPRRPLGAPPSVVDSIDDPFSLQSGRGA